MFPQTRLQEQRQEETTFPKWGLLRATPKTSLRLAMGFIPRRQSLQGTLASKQSVAERWKDCAGHVTPCSFIDRQILCCPAAPLPWHLQTRQGTRKAKANKEILDWANIWNSPWEIISKVWRQRTDCRQSMKHQCEVGDFCTPLTGGFCKEPQWCKSPW